MAAYAGVAGNKGPITPFPWAWQRPLAVSRSPPITYQEPLGTQGRAHPGSRQDGVGTAREGSAWSQRRMALWASWSPARVGQAEGSQGASFRRLWREREGSLSPRSGD